MVAGTNQSKQAWLPCQPGILAACLLCLVPTTEATNISNFNNKLGGNVPLISLFLKYDVYGMPTVEYRQIQI